MPAIAASIRPNRRSAPTCSRRIALFTWALVLSAIFGRSVLAQTRVDVHGAVVDVATRAPLSRVEVSVHYVGDTVKYTTATDSTGRFRIGSTGPRPFVIIARRIGFAPDSLVVREPLRTDSVTISLSSVATLEKVVVDAAPLERSLMRHGYYDRQKAGFGTFLDSAKLAAKAPLSLFAILGRTCTAAR